MQRSGPQLIGLAVILLVGGCNEDPATYGDHEHWLPLKSLGPGAVAVGGSWSTGSDAGGLIHIIESGLAQTHTFDRFQQVAMVYDFLGYGVDNLYAIGTSGNATRILHFDGTIWSDEGALDALCVGGAEWPSGDRILVGPDGGIFRITDAGSTRIESGTTALLRRVWGRSGEDYWVIGSGGVVCHVVAQVASLVPLATTADFWGIVGFEDSTIYCVGAGGTVAILSGGEWDVNTTAVPGSLRSVWGTDSGNVYVAGDEGLYHYDGNSWAPVATGGSGAYVAVTGSAVNDVFAIKRIPDPEFPAMESSHLLHFDGSAWTEVFSAR